MYSFYNTNVIDFNVSNSLKAYYNDEYRRNELSPYSISSLSASNDILVVHNDSSYLFSTFEK